MSTIYALDNFLIAQIAHFLPSPLDASFRATCKYIRAALRAPIRMKSRDLICRAAEIGCRELCEYARAKYGEMLQRMYIIVPYGVYDDIDCDIAEIGSRGDDLAICKLALDWSGKSESVIMQTCVLGIIAENAAAKNNYKLCTFVLDFMTIHPKSLIFTKMVSIAAANGNREICTLVRDRGCNLLAREDDSRSSYLRYAAQSGDRALCDFFGAQYANEKDLLEILIGAIRGDAYDLFRDVIARISPISIAREYAEIICAFADSAGKYEVLAEIRARSPDAHIGAREIIRYLMSCAITARRCSIIDMLIVNYRDECATVAPYIMQAAVSARNRALYDFARAYIISPEPKILKNAIRTQSYEFIPLIIQWMDEIIDWDKVLVCAAKVGLKMFYFVREELERHGVLLMMVPNNLHRIARVQQQDIALYEHIYAELRGNGMQLNESDFQYLLDSAIAMNRRDVYDLVQNWNGNPNYSREDMMRRAQALQNAETPGFVLHIIT